MPVFNKKDMVAAGTFQAPPGNYHIRAVDAQYELSSKKQTPMIVIDWEIFSPIEVTVGGEVYPIAGSKFQERLILAKGSIPFLLKKEGFFDVFFPNIESIDTDDKEQLQVLAKACSQLVAFSRLFWKEGFLKEGEDYVLNPVNNQKVSNGYQIYVTRHWGHSDQIPNNPAI